MICGRKQSGGLFSLTWQRAKRGDRHGSAEKKSLPACHKNRVHVLCALFLFYDEKRKGFEQGRSKSMICGRKQSD